MSQLHRVLLLVASAAALVFAVSPVTAVGGPPKHPKHCKKGKQGKKCQPSRPGRMTGAGTVITSQYGRSQHVFRNSVCNSDRFPDLKVQWAGGNRFDLTSYSSPLRCVDTAADEGQPRAGFDTIIGQGTGVLNGVGGASASFSFTDAGEPGRNDTATITITDRNGNIVFQLNNEKIAQGGNHQAHAK